jgi:hypothetical protein
MTTSQRFNPRAYWEALSPTQQRAVGEAALLIALFEAGRDASPDGHAAARCSHAMEEGSRRLRRVIGDASVWPEGPDLAVLGIRACRECGCTDASACPGGCSWVADDLCSACAPPEIGRAA